MTKAEFDLYKIIEFYILSFYTLKKQFIAMMSIFKNKKFYFVLLISIVVLASVAFSAKYLFCNNLSLKEELLKIENNHLSKYSKKKYVKTALARVDIHKKRELRNYILKRFDLFLTSNINLSESITNYANLYRDSFDLLLDLKKSGAIFSADYREMRNSLNSFKFDEVLNRAFYMTLKNNRSDLVAKKKYLEGVMFELMFNYEGAKKAYLEAIALNYYEARYYVSLGGVYYKIYDFNSAIDVYNTGLSISNFNSKRNRMEELELLFNLAKTYTVVRENEKALRVYSNLLVNSIAFGNDKYEWLSIYNIADIEANYGNYSVSLDYLRYSLKLATKMRNRFYIANSMNRLSKISYRYGDYDAGKKNGLKAIKLSKNISHMELMAEASLNTCLNYEYLGKMDLAKIYCERAIRINKVIGKTIDRPEYSLSNGHIFSFVASVRNYEKSMESYVRALTISKNHGLLLFEAAALAGVSEAESYLGKYDEAIRNLTSSIAIETKLNIKYKPCGDCSFGYLYWQKGDNTKAIAYYNGAINSAVKVGNNLVISSAASHVASIYFDMAKYESALNYSRIALAADRRIYRYDHHYIKYQEDRQQKIINKLGK